MRLLETSSTVTGRASPSSVKMRVMPTLRPTNPMLMFLASVLRCRLQLAGKLLQQLLHFDFYIHSRGKIELHERVHRLVGRVDDVHQPQMRPDLELLARGLVGMRRAQEIESLLAGRQRYGPAHDRAGALRRVDDLERRLIDQPVVERLEANAD